MLINGNYNEIFAQAKTKMSSSANFNNLDSTRSHNTVNQDTLTLSNQALSLLEGNKSVIQEISPIYVRPQTSAELLANSQNNQSTLQVTASSLDENKVKNITEPDSRFGDMMQAILDKRLGVDREKLEESIDIKKVAKETFIENDENS